MNRSIFISRETEVAKLQKYYDSNESEFVVVDGRSVWARLPLSTNSLMIRFMMTK